jgi:hypothetical protein
VPLLIEGFQGLPKCGGQQCGLGDFNAKTQRKQNKLYFLLFLYIFNKLPSAMNRCL